MLPPNSPVPSDAGERAALPPSPAVPPGPTAFPVVGVGASAGGLEALTQLLRNLPASPGLALVLVQHLDPRHESLLASILAQATALSVCEATQGTIVEKNRVYVIPPNTHLTIAGGALALQPRQGQPSPHMPIDAFFRSLAEDVGCRAVGIVLSGGGSDGTLGLEAIKAADGITFAQDEASATQSSMPRSAVAAGCVDFVLPPEGIARELVRIGNHPYVTLAADPTPEEVAPADESDLAGLFALLRARTGVDFSHYKRNTIRRRVQRRMALLGLTDLAEFVRVARGNPAEVQALFQDLLIRVTSFFRDPGAFDALQKTVFPAVIKELAPEEAIRVWVPGCSTGEEAYSLAIALTEFLGHEGANIPIKILATDVNETVLEKARAGTYLENIARDLAPERLRRFFQKTGSQYRISKSIRDLCVFSHHNVFLDPPFARLTLISCRNVLIYLDVALQRRVLPLFHYALRPGGYLLLGPSESIGTSTDLFSVADRASSLYVRTLTPARIPLERGMRDAEGGPAVSLLPIGPALEEGGLLDIQREADRVLARYAPAGVVIDDNHNVLQFRGDTSPYLRNPPGTANLEVLRMAHEGLLPDLRQAILAAQASNAPAHREGVRVSGAGPARTVTVKVIPLRAGRSGLRSFLVLFEQAEVERHADSQRSGSPTAGAPLSPNEADERLVQLQRELEATREHLQSVIEVHEATNEELKSASEEILASNEELQSTNEELQTAKEEMHSANEELETTNDELHHRIGEVSRINDDLTNLLVAAYIPIVMVNRDLRIRRFTVQAEKLFNLVLGDVGRPFRDIRSEFDGPDLEQIFARVIDTLAAAALEIRDRSGRWYSLRVRPYETADNKIDGAVITVIDIDAIKQVEQELRASRDFVASILDTVQESLVVLDEEDRVRTANRSFYRTFRQLPEEVANRPFFELGDGQWNIPRLRALVAQARGEGEASREAELEHSFPVLGPRILRIIVRPVPGVGGSRSLTLLALEDITEQRRAERAGHDLEMQMFQAQKMESLGVLAGGIAHDLNNMLTPVLGYTELAKRSLSPDAATLPLLDEVEKATWRAAELVQQVLAYAGKGIFVVQIIDLSGLVRDLEGLLRSAVSKQVELRFELTAAACPVEADATQLRQVVVNLVTNASEAIGPSGGTIILRTGQVQADAESLRSPYLKGDLPPGLYTFLEVADTGCGMSPATMEKMFDPFFTTKFTGRGLGLAAAQGIVQGHRGVLHVRSEPGQGSTFRLLLPSTTKPLPLPEAPVEAAIWRATGTILVVDDEAGVRSVASHYLAQAGFTLLQAGDGQEGLAAFRERAQDIVVVLLDLTMPKMGGLELARALRGLRPDIPIILMSGYSCNEMEGQYGSQGFAAFVPKPFDRGALLAAVRLALRQ